MASSPNTWNVDDPIYITLFLADPTTEAGLTGKASKITLIIQRLSDDKYWTGSAWSATKTNLTMTEEDATNLPGTYTYTLSAAANNQADFYRVFSTVDDPPDFNGNQDTELHMSRDLEVRVYESESE